MPVTDQLVSVSRIDIRSVAAESPAVSIALQAAPEVQSADDAQGRVASFAHAASGKRSVIRRGPCSWIQRAVFAPSFVLRSERSSMASRTATILQPVKGPLSHCCVDGLRNGAW